MKRRKSPLTSSATFTAVEMYRALLAKYPDRFPDVAKTGITLFQAELVADDVLVVHYGAKR